MDGRFAGTPISSIEVISSARSSICCIKPGGNVARTKYRSIYRTVIRFDMYNAVLVDYWFIPLVLEWLDPQHIILG